jgi:hypothetical protein
MHTTHLALPSSLLFSTPSAKADAMTFEGLSDGITVTNQFSNLRALQNNNHNTKAKSPASLAYDSS